MKKFLLIMFVTINCYSLPVEITNNVADVTKEIVARAESLETLEGLMSSISSAQSLEQQIKALSNLSDFQKNPSGAVSQVNDAVKKLLGSLNTNSGTSFTNLKQLIGGLSTSSTAMSMSIKLTQATNMELVEIENTLQAMQAQQNAMIAYQQAAIAQEQDATKKLEANNQATISAMRAY